MCLTAFPCVQYQFNPWPYDLPWMHPFFWNGLYVRTKSLFISPVSTILLILKHIKTHTHKNSSNSSNSSKLINTQEISSTLKKSQILFDKKNQSQDLLGDLPNLTCENHLSGENLCKTHQNT